VTRKSTLEAAVGLPPTRLIELTVGA
jgi:hypothetical protein